MAKLQFNTYWNDKQKQMFSALLDNTNWITDVWYGWWAWWWKSYWWVAWQWMIRNKYSWTRGFFGRKELKRLKQTTLATYYKFCDDYKIPLIQRWVLNSQDWVIRFPNWSEILLLDLSYMPSDPLYQRFGSLELTDGFADEIAEIDAQCLMILKTRIWRQKNEEYNLLPKFLGTFNPDKWHVYRDYYKADKDWTLPEYRIFIKALATDNKKLPRVYIEQLRKADRITQERLLYWNFEYDDTPWRLFNYDKILELDKPKTPYNKTRYISCDAARKWKDSCVIIVWEWFNKLDITIFEKCSVTEIIEEIRRLQNLHNVDNQNTIVDEDWVWWWVVDWLWCVWFINNSSPISPYWAKNNNYLKRNYQNLKTQCYFELARVVNDNIMYVKLDWLYHDRLCEELDIIVQTNLDKDSKITIISKEEIKDKLGRSPDFSDTLMMRCYFNLVYWWIENEEEEVKQSNKREVIYDWFDSLEDAMNEIVEFSEDWVI